MTVTLGFLLKVTFLIILIISLRKKIFAPPPAEIIFDNSLNISVIPAGYPFLEYKLAGAGGAGGSDVSGAGGGGGSGAYVSGKISVSEGESISIEQGFGGIAEPDSTLPIDGSDTILTIGSRTFIASGGKGGIDGSNGIPPGIGGLGGLPIPSGIPGNPGQNAIFTNLGFPQPNGYYIGGNGGSRGGGGGGGGAGTINQGGSHGLGGMGFNGAQSGGNAVTSLAGNGGHGYFWLKLSKT